MCTIFYAYNSQPDYYLVVAANRDEFLDRQTASANFWPSQPNLLAGQDLKHKGTWLGLTTGGRFCSITNYREPGTEISGAESRGLLALDYLSGTMPPMQYVNDLCHSSKVYNGYNLIAGDSSALWYFSNRLTKPRQLTPGLYGLSNHLLDTPWPKVLLGHGFVKQALRSFNGPADEDRLILNLFEIMQNEEKPPDDQLPRTGLSIDKERQLSSVFIRTENYGTRATTVILWHKSGRVRFIERNHQTNYEQAFVFEITA